MRGGGTSWRRRSSRVVVAVGLLALTGCTASEPAPRTGPEPSPSAEPSTLATYDTTGVALSRSPFCDRVSPTGIEKALGEVARSHDDYLNGDRIQLPDGSRSIAHEYGCSWRSTDGTTARAWVFAPPVTRGRAGQLASEAASEGCTRTGAGDFGSPSVATRCQTEDGQETSWRGLFGDAWLVCTLTGRGRATRLEERTSEWCVAVLEAARA